MNDDEIKALYGVTTPSDALKTRILESIGEKQAVPAKIRRVPRPAALFSIIILAALLTVSVYAAVRAITVTLMKDALGEMSADGREFTSNGAYTVDGQIGKVELKGEAYDELSAIAAANPTVTNDKAKRFGTVSEAADYLGIPLCDSPMLELSDPADAINGVYIYPRLNPSTGELAALNMVVSARVRYAQDERSATVYDANGEVDIIRKMPARDYLNVSLIADAKLTAEATVQRYVFDNIDSAADSKTVSYDTASGMQTEIVATTNLLPLNDRYDGVVTETQHLVIGYFIKDDVMYAAVLSMSGGLSAPEGAEYRVESGDDEVDYEAEAVELMKRLLDSMG